MEWDDFLARIERNYGEPGVNGALSADISEADLARGYEHCERKCLPHIEEELLAGAES